jgi:hypothetical protein
MFKKLDPLVDPLVLSNSGVACMNDCERRFCHRYLLKTPKDPDFKDPAYFGFGRAFHGILEHTAGDPKRYSASAIGRPIVEKNGLNWDNDGAKISAMLRTFWLLAAQRPLAIAACEVEFENDIARGKIDAIGVDDQLNWYICDWKTTGVSLDLTKPAMLRQDPQLCLYGALSEDIAAQLNLEPHKFAGVLLREIEKPRHRWKEGETFDSFHARISEKGNPAGRDMFVPIDELQWQDSYGNFLEAVKRARALQQEWIAGNETPGRQDTRNCKQWGSPCEFWSQCYEGKTFTEMSRPQAAPTAPINPLEFL